VSDISSAGSNGKTCRQDVLGGVDVPVVPGAAGRALPRPGAKRELREQVPAGGAGLAAREEPADHDQAPPRPGRLVLEQAAEVTPAAVRYGLGERVVMDHVLHGEVFDHDHVVVADHLGGGAVQEVDPRRADLAVRPGDLGPGLGPVDGALLAAGQAPLVAGQAAFPASQATRVGDLLPVAGDGEVLDAQVHAHDGADGGQRRGLGHLHGEGDVPAAARVAGDRHRARVERRRVDIRPGPGERQRRAHLGEEQPPVAVPEPGAGVRGGLPPGPGLVAGVAGAPGEEAGERGLLTEEAIMCMPTRGRGATFPPRPEDRRLHAASSMTTPRPRPRRVAPLPRCLRASDRIGARYSSCQAGSSLASAARSAGSRPSTSARTRWLW
jgi:hypothetical protein